MRFLLYCLLAISLSKISSAHEIFIPEQFQEGQSIEEVILIFDVDGVIRESIEDTADLRIIHAIKSLMKNKNVDVAFISGTPIDNDSTLEPWRRGNVSLNRVFGSLFEKELEEDSVTIYGVLGGHKMRGDGSLEIADEYPSNVSFEIGNLLLHSFFREVMNQGSPEQKNMATLLQRELNSLKLDDHTQSTNATAKEFNQIVSVIREHLDPNFRLITNGASVEAHISNPPWSSTTGSKWLQEEMEKPQYLISSLERQTVAGFAKKGTEGFNFLLVSKTNKGLTSKKHIEEKLKKFPKALIITIGDTQLDFPMHKNAHLAFHVGLKSVWAANNLSQCFMIHNQNGKDSQHVTGTLQVLSLLEEALGKSFYDFRYIPKCDSLGMWRYYSPRELLSKDLLAENFFKE
ncbi:MAG: hypothetical protein V4489_04380 [Chlamydiota bacterium]